MIDCLCVLNFRNFLIIKHLLWATIKVNYQQTSWARNKTSKKSLQNWILWQLEKFINFPMKTLSKTKKNKNLIFIKKKAWKPNDKLIGNEYVFSNKITQMKFFSKTVLLSSTTLNWITVDQWRQSMRNNIWKTFYVPCTS